MHGLKAPSNLGPKVARLRRRKSSGRALLFAREALDALVVFVVVDVEHEGARVKVDAVLRVGDLETAPNKNLLNTPLLRWSIGHAKDLWYLPSLRTA